jgi:hypothetical protein
MQRPSLFGPQNDIGHAGVRGPQKTFLASSLIDGIRLMSTKFGAFGFGPGACEWMASAAHRLSKVAKGNCTAKGLFN